MEQIEEIRMDENGNVLNITTESYRVIFPEKKLPTKENNFQKGDVFRFECQSEGGTPFGPLVVIQKPGLERPSYSEIVPNGCIQSRRQ